ncbi:ribonuclease D [Olsenella uli DSM 7084]|uniref:Ribonuclease D n=1 Tax=Olsenella uli (strain ATCC 49627 / DSM 7084 / CCUG 31166 / CIP 109912 / JCM 12494 / LMG 11480 / NCIMB 702895 / VPI D76D-27C) TaxID=633147 RepID=E1QZW0_OLSUV|nr:ribonuclease D [Olsenella uli]ADK67924.1 ribonuclease D [Olsenella uli DSM 7084]KRO13283.1 ribonuclease D [Olsenella uli DSM 7084]
MYISDHEGLTTFCKRVATSRVLAIDTEFLRERTYFPRLCLIQAATPDESAAIDPILIDDLSPLARLLTDESITKVFHACSQDLEVIYDALHCVPGPIFDTQLAAAFLGHRQQIGYGALVDACCGVRLPKAESLTDWSRRPLDAEQLAYAEDDVRYLPGIYDQMMAELIMRDRLPWLAPEMAELVSPAHFMRVPEEAYLHLRRSGSLTRRQLAIAREVCAWRESAAARRDVPRKWVVSDELIVEACKRAPRTLDRLRRIRGAESLGERDAKALIEAVGRGASCPAEKCPSARRKDRPSPDTESVIDLMYAMLRLVAERSGVATQLIATRDDLLEFVSHREESRLAHSWRYELAGRQLTDLLEGKVGLTVKDGRVETL